MLLKCQPEEILESGLAHEDYSSCAKFKVNPDSLKLVASGYSVTVKHLYSIQGECI